MSDQQPTNPFVLINTFTAVEGGLDALTELQSVEAARMSVDATAHGWLGNEAYRTLDGTSLIVITRFRSPEARARWADTPQFQRHVGELRPLVREIVSTPVFFASAHGEPRSPGVFER